MWIQQFIQSLTSGSTRPRLLRRRAASRLCFEPLEDRRLLAFSPLGEYGAGLNPVGLVAADFNDDGQLDLATNSVGVGIGVLLGNGDAAFQPVQYSGTGSSGAPVLARDLNGDAKIDLVTINEDDRNLRVLLGNGDGTFQPPLPGLVLPSQLPPDSPNAHPLQSPVSVAVGDLNADSNLDLVAAGYDVEEIVFWEVYRQHDYANVLLGNGDGTFGPSTAYQVPTTDNTIAKPSMLEVSDFDGDGKSDVLMSDQGSEIVLLGNGDGTLQTPPQPSWFEYQGGADINADGIVDSLSLVGIVVYYSDSGATTARTARVQLGNEDGSIAPPLVSDLGTVQAASYFESRVLADFDGDGFPDLAVIERRYPEGGIPYGIVSVVRNDGNWPPLPTTPSISINDVMVTEGNTGTRAGTFTVTLSAAYSLPVTVTYATASGTAAAGSDYQAASGTLTIPAGQTMGTITVLAKGDRVAEPNETFYVYLSSGTGVMIADGQGAGTIVDDEPRIVISDVTKAEGRKGKTTLFTFTVTLSAAYDQPVTMAYRTVNGTATTGNSDYVAKTGTLTFAPGETTKTITISVKGDNKREANETFYLDLFGNSSNSLFTKHRGVGTILNDD